MERDAAEAEGAMFQHLDIMEKDLLNRLQVTDGDSSNRKALFSSNADRSRPGEENNFRRNSFTTLSIAMEHCIDEMCKMRYLTEDSSGHSLSPRGRDFL